MGNGNAVGVQGGIGDGNTFPASAATLAVQGVNFATGTGGTGVQGLVQSNPTTRVGASQGMGVEGLNYSIGPNANGSASGSIGVEGTIGVNADSSTAVNGLNLSTAPITYGVAGTSYGSNGAGLFGINYSSGVGAQGSSTAGHGLVGTTQATDGHAGLFGGGFAAGAIGVRGSAFVAGATAGVFDGDVIITGALSSTFPICMAGPVAFSLPDQQLQIVPGLFACRRLGVICEKSNLETAITLSQSIPGLPQ